MQFVKKPLTKLTWQSLSSLVTGLKWYQIHRNETWNYFFPCTIIQIDSLKLLGIFKMLSISKNRFSNPTHLTIGKMGQVCAILRSPSKIGSLYDFVYDLIFKTFDGTGLDHRNSAKARG